MYRIFQADKDSYITNKIISNTLRATDSNTGQAGTIDLFKLYDENTYSGEENSIELSRALVHFDISDLRQSINNGDFNINSPSFTCSLYLHDVYGGQTTPTNFSLVVYPLSKSFDEGSGRDVVRFEDIDVSNFITASVSTTVVTWSISGANSGGDITGSNIDYFTQGDLNDGSGVTSFGVSQIFSTGQEDLSVNVTRIMSGVLSNRIPDSGFRISFIQSQENDQKTRFVKRFASRNTTNTAKKPKLIVIYDDTIQDKTQNFEFNTSGSIFLNTFSNGTPANLVSGSLLTSLTGANCLKLKIQSGSIERTYVGSQHSVGGNFITGIYSASFLVNSYDSDLYQKMTGSAINEDSFEFGVKWLSLDETVQFATGSLDIKRRETTYFSQTPERYFINITNMKSSYKDTEKARFKLFIEDFNRKIVFVKTPLENTGIIAEKCLYRIRDYESGDIIIPFHDPGTQISNDSTTHYFDFYMSSLPKGRTYTFDFRIIRKGQEITISDVAAKFRVE